MKIEQQEIEEVQSEKKYSAKEISLEILKENTTQTKVKEARKKLEKIETLGRVILIQLIREFDPGSG